MKHFPSSKSLFWSSLIMLLFSLISPLFTVTYESLFGLLTTDKESALAAAFNVPFYIFVMSLVVLCIAIARLITEKSTRNQLVILEGTDNEDSVDIENKQLTRKIEMPTAVVVLIWVILGIVASCFAALMFFSFD